MKYIEWESTYDVGETRIDIQHRHLVSLINMLHAGVSAHMEDQLVGSILDELGMYALVHFSYEEKWMEEVGYPELSEHKLLHINLRQSLDKYREDFNLRQAHLSGDLYEFLHGWLMDHILEEDKKLSDYV